MLTREREKRERERERERILMGLHQRLMTEGRSNPSVSSLSRGSRSTFYGIYLTSAIPMTHNNEGAE